MIKVNKKSDGTLIIKIPDDSEHIIKTDGTLIDKKPDGSKYIIKSDGEIYKTKPNGEKIISNQEPFPLSDGIRHEFPGGCDYKSIKKHDGTLIGKFPGGYEYTITPDGKSDLKTPDKPKKA